MTLNKHLFGFHYCFRSRIHYTDMYEMLRKMEPPVGFGKNCPYRLAYRVSSACKCLLTLHKSRKSYELLQSVSNLQDTYELIFLSVLIIAFDDDTSQSK